VRLRVTGPARLVIVDAGGFPAWDVVWVVTGGAAELALALEKTCRLTEAVRSARDLDRRVSPRRPVERNLKIAKRRPGHIRERPAPVLQDGVRQLEAAGLEVALETNLELAVRRELLRIDDRRLARRRDVLASVAMASLAVDPRGQGREVLGSAAARVRPASSIALWQNMH
jgi:hypothetical protein